MNVVPLIAAVAMFALVFFSIRHPERIRAWLRQDAPIRVTPASWRRHVEDAAPIMFAIQGMILGIAALISFIEPLVR
ncbi:hypothetical protein [Catellatospora sp. NPDC049133]|jgi:hypothetical protein|uniref:hypothetical protein n=1 Tax=Catellatospora sp. NPDC049133 TaxID=3155499 RepID=UPI0033CAA65B